MTIIEYAKSSNRNILKILDEILTKPFLFYTDRQKIKFVKRVINVCETFGTNRLIIQHINDRLNDITI